MYIVLEKDTKRVVVMLPEDDDVVLDEKNLTSSSLIVSDISSTTHDLVIGLPPEPPIYWVAGALRYSGGVWEILDQLVYDAHLQRASEKYHREKEEGLASAKKAKKARLAEIANAKLSAGFTVNGLKISTDADARGLLSLGKIGNKPSRKVVTASGQRAILTAIQFSDVVAAADNYGQNIMNRWYDLDEALDNATADTIDSIDINVGWPT